MSEKSDNGLAVLFGATKSGFRNIHALLKSVLVPQELS